MIKLLMNKINMVMLLLFSTTSCSKDVDSKGFLIPGTQIFSAELILAEDLPQHYYLGQYTDHRLCLNDTIKKGWLDSFVGPVLQTEIINFGLPDGCQITFLDKKHDSRAYDFYIKKHGCDYYFQMSKDGIQYMDVIVNKSDITSFRKCLYRTGLFSMGFNGALDIEDERLFVLRSESSWAAMHKGPKYVTEVQDYLSQCNFKMQKFASRQDVIEASKNMRCEKIK